jgi:release factor glutamine methyltransferase
MLKKEFETVLGEIYPPEEIASLFYLLAEARLRLKRIDLALQPQRELSAAELEYFRDAQRRLAQNEPVQYILGYTEFYGLHFKVTPATLIPRPETEELVAWVVDDLQSKNRSMDILDIGTGSGCIAVSLANKLPKARVSAVDVSEAALAVAAQNATDNKVDVHFFSHDILSEQHLPNKFDAIVSNPPYVRELEKREMHNNVLQYEPASALYVPNGQPLLFYEAIATFAKAHLHAQGTLYLEINEYLSEPMRQLMENEGFTNVHLRKDFRGKYRMLKCNLP